jgi:hypothetical protein
VQLSGMVHVVVKGPSNVPARPVNAIVMVASWEPGCQEKMGWGKETRLGSVPVNLENGRPAARHFGRDASAAWQSKYSGAGGATVLPLDAKALILGLGHIERLCRTPGLRSGWLARRLMSNPELHEGKGRNFQRGKGKEKRGRDWEFWGVQ